MAIENTRDGLTTDRKDSSDRPSTFIAPSDRPAYDSTVTLEEYMYYARQTREEEKALVPNPEKAGGLLAQVFRRKAVDTMVNTPGAGSPNGASEKAALGGPEADGRAKISPDEWRNASRLMRTASCK